MLSSAEAIKKYGMPNQDGTYLAYATTAYPMRLAWDLSQTVHRIRLHKDVVKSFETISKELLNHYGEAKLVSLGIDIFGGSFAYRQKRGGDSWSLHAFGLAVDLHPTKNTLKMNRNIALFAKPEYSALMDIFDANGWENLGVKRNFDYMHFQVKE